MKYFFMTTYVLLGILWFIITILIGGIIRGNIFKNALGYKGSIILIILSFVFGFVMLVVITSNL